MSRVEPERNRYVGHRYVPKIFGEWDKQNEYEGLSIVTHQGTSYTSKKRVPVGIDILNEEFWVVTGNYNAQVEDYRQEVRNYKIDTDKQIEEYKTDTDNTINEYKTDTDNTINEYKTDMDNKVDDYQTQTGLLVNSKVDKDDLIVNISDHGIDPDSNLDVTSQLQDILNTHKNVMIPEGNYILKSKLIIPEGVKIHGSKGAVLKVDHDGIGVEVRQKSTITGNLSIKVKDDYRGSAVWFDGSLSTGTQLSSFENTFIGNLTVEGNVQGGGNGIHFECTKAPSSISFVTLDNIFIRGFERGIFIDCPPLESGSNYVNGVLMSNITIKNCSYYYYSTGDHSSRGNQGSGNTVTNLQLQWTDRCKEFIHIEGRHNDIQGMGWDIGGKNSIYVYLGRNSSRNILDLNYNADTSNIIDMGDLNYVRQRDDNRHVIPSKSIQTHRRLGDRTFHGDYEDILHNSPLLHDVNITQGESNINSGVIDDVFQGDTHKYMAINLDNDKEFEFEINFNGSVYPGHKTESYLPGRLRNIGFQFEHNWTPKKIVLEVTGRDNEVISTEHDLSFRRYDLGVVIVANSINGLQFNGIKKVKIKFVGQFSNLVRFSRIFANSDSVGGNRFLSNSGGIIAGDLEVRGNLKTQNNTLFIPKRNNRPSNDPFYHGQMFLIEKPEADDEVVIGIKDASGSIKWITLNP